MTRSVSLSLSLILAALALCVLAFPVSAFTHTPASASASTRAPLNGAAFLKPRVSVLTPARRSRLGGLCMLRAEDVSVCVVEVLGDEVQVKATVFSDGMERTWTFRRDYDEFDDFQMKMNKLYGFSMPPLPPKSFISSPDVLESYFDSIFENERALSAQILMDFMQMPKDLISQPTLRNTNRIIDVTPERIPSSSDDLTPQAAGAGAVFGGLLGGPFGAVLGGAAAAWASKQEGPVGEIARTAGKAADVAVKKAKVLDRKYSVTERAAKNLKSGLKQVRDALDKLDLDDKKR